LGGKGLAGQKQRISEELLAFFSWACVKKKKTGKKTKGSQVTARARFASLPAAMGKTGGGGRGDSAWVSVSALLGKGKVAPGEGSITKFRPFGAGEYFCDHDLCKRKKKPKGARPTTEDLNRKGESLVQKRNSDETGIKAQGLVEVLRAQTVSSVRKAPKKNKGGGGKQKKWGVGGLHQSTRRPKALYTRSNNARSNCSLGIVGRNSKREKTPKKSKKKVHRQAPFSRVDFSKV